LNEEKLIQVQRRTVRILDKQKMNDLLKGWEASLSLQFQGQFQCQSRCSVSVAVIGPSTSQFQSQWLDFGRQNLEGKVKYK
jgi:hypothetical protein